MNLSLTSDTETAEVGIGVLLSIYRAQLVPGICSSIRRGFRSPNKERLTIDRVRCCDVADVFSKDDRETTAKEGQKYTVGLRAVAGTHASTTKVSQLEVSPKKR